MIEIFNSLIGNWNIDRVIKPGGVFKGHAVFNEVSGNELLYQELGVLTLDNGEVLTDVQKSYSYKYEDGKISIYFNDGVYKGKLFHQLEFNGKAQASALHECPPDNYKSFYDFISSDEFIIEHKVKGAQKDYFSSSRYTR